MLLENCKHAVAGLFFLFAIQPVLPVQANLPVSCPTYYGSGAAWGDSRADRLQAESDGNNLFELRPGAIVERPLKGGEVHRYHVNLSQSQYLRLLVEHTGIEVGVTLDGPEGQPLVKVGSPDGTDATEILSWITGEAGKYTLEVGSGATDVLPGRYAATLQELRRSTAVDKSHVIADTQFLEGRILEGKGGASVRDAVRKYIEALDHWQAVQNFRESGRVLDRLGEASALLDEKEKAHDYLDRALQAERRAADKRGEAQSLNNLGELVLKDDNFQSAREDFLHALDLERAEKDRVDEATSFYTIWELAPKNRAICDRR